MTYRRFSMTCRHCGGLQGGALSMGEILGRMADAVALELQAAERELCSGLDELARRLLADLLPQPTVPAPAAGDPPVGRSRKRSTSATASSSILCGRRTSCGREAVSSISSDADCGRSACTATS